jgi:hypothetical protein
MAWSIGIFAVLVLVAFAVGYRKVAASLLAIALAIAVLLYMQHREEEHLALTRIPSSELVFESVTLKPYVGSYKIAGRIKNNSAKFSVRQIDLVVTVKDCTQGAAEPQCVIIGESNEILNLNIPPGEARDLEEAVRFYGSNPKLKGRMEWSYAVSRIRAE